MTQTNVNVQMQIRRDTTANWQSNNTTLLDGEWGYVKDTNIFKIGNGSTQFNFLPEAVLSSNGSYSSPLFISNYHLKITSQKELRFSDDVACTPFTERFDNDVTGWRADFDIVVSFNASACTTDTM